MKRIVFGILILAYSLNVLAQAPEKMTYQAVIRDIDNKLIQEQKISIQISILEGSIYGSAIYVETHSPTTNNNGLATLQIGAGEVLNGEFADIKWASNLYFLKTEVDPTGGNSYSIETINQMLSVPYALHAKTAESLSNGSAEEDPIFSDSPAAGIDEDDISNINNLSGKNTGDQDISDFLTEEEDPEFTKSQANNIDKTDIKNLGNLSGTNTGDQDLSDYATEEYVDEHSTGGGGSAIFDADNNTSIQLEKTTNDDVIRFSIAGTEHWTMNESRLEAVNNSSSIFIGSGSGKSNSAGHANTYIGDSTGHFNASGAGNSIIGYSAGYKNNSGDFNTQMGTESGYNTMGDKNSFFGARAGYKNSSGGENCCIGYGAGYSNSSGSDNCFIGNSAGYYNLSGSGNVFIGSDAGANELSSNTLIIDNSNSSSPLIFGDFYNDELVINGNSADNSNSYTLFVNGNAGGNNAWNNASDKRLKKNIETIKNPLTKVLKLRGVNFEWIDTNTYDTGRQMGFIAQEAEGILDEIIDRPITAEAYYAMQYAPITALLVEAIKEQQRIIDYQQTKINEMEDLKKRVQKLEAMMNKD